MLVVHHLNNSRSHRIIWLLEELGKSYRVKYHQRNTQTRRAPPELKSVHSLGKAPTITDGNNALAESGAIIEYILLRYGHGRLQPDPASSSYNEFMYWMHYPEGSALPTLSMRDIAANLAGAGSSLLQALDAEIADHLSHLDSALDGRPYILGDEFSAADIQLSFLGELAGCKVGISPYANVARWVARFQERSAYKEAIGRGGDYSLAEP